MSNFILTINAAPELLAALSNLANSINAVKAASILENNFSEKTITSSYEPSQISAPAKTYTMEQIAIAATQLVEEGRRKEFYELLNSFAIQALTALPKEQYSAFGDKLKKLGANI
jgi:hypothetical protein